MASKKASSFVNMVVILLIVSAVAATSLAYVYKFTKGPIAAAKLKKKKKAIAFVVPDFDAKVDPDPIAAMYKVGLAENDTLECYPVKKGEDLIGVAVKTYTKLGFSGKIWLMVGFSTDGSISNISVLEHKETPGLGDKMEKKKSKWSNQFNGKKPGDKELTVSKDGGEIDAITASTITSRAFCDAVNRAYKAFQQKK